MSQLFAWGGQSIGVSASASVLPMNTQDWSPLGWTGWISLQSKGLSGVFSNITVQKHQFFWCSAFFRVQLLHPYMTTGKTIVLTKWTFVGKVISLLLNMLSRLVVAFLPGSKRLLISWLQSPSAVILEPKKIVCRCFHCFPFYLPWSDGIGCHDLKFFECWILSLLFHCSLSLSLRSSSVFLRFLPKDGVMCIVEVIDFSGQAWFQLVLHPALHFTWCTLHVS